MLLPPTPSPLPPLLLLLPLLLPPSPLPPLPLLLATMAAAAKGGCIR
jgi:hypothetical protein